MNINNPAKEEHTMHQTMSTLNNFEVPTLNFIIPPIGMTLDKRQVK